MVHKQKPTVTREAFAARLNKARENAGLSQRELAEAIDAHYNRVGEWTRGERWPNIKHLAALADTLHVEIDWLLRGTRRSTPSPTPAQAEAAIVLARDIAVLAPSLVQLARRADRLSTKPKRRKK